MSEAHVTPAFAADLPLAPQPGDDDVADPVMILTARVADLEGRFDGLLRALASGHRLPAPPEPAPPEAA